MTNEYRNAKLAEAQKHVATARAKFDAAKPCTKAWRDAAADLEFWTNKTAFLSNARI